MTKQQIEALSKITGKRWWPDWDDNGQWYIQPLGLTGTLLRGDSGECIEAARAVAISSLPDLLSEREKMITALRKTNSHGCSCFSASGPDWHSDRCHIPAVRAVLAEAEGIE